MPPPGASAAHTRLGHPRAGAGAAAADPLTSAPRKRSRRRCRRAPPHHAAASAAPGSRVGARRQAHPRVRQRTAAAAAPGHRPRLAVSGRPPAAPRRGCQPFATHGLRARRLSSCWTRATRAAGHRPGRQRPGHAAGGGRRHRHRRCTGGAGRTAGEGALRRSHPDAEPAAGRDGRRTTARCCAPACRGSRSAPPAAPRAPRLPRPAG